MELMSLWLLFGFVGLWIGPKKGHSPLIGFLAGVLLGPFVLLLGLTSPTAKKCPFCAEMIKPEAIVCPKCQREQPGKAAPKPVAAPETETQRRLRIQEQIRAAEEAKAARIREVEKKHGVGR